MWKIKQIFDGDYGCEELQPGQKPKVSVTLVDDAGNEKLVSVEDDWLTEHAFPVLAAKKNSSRDIVLAVTD